MYFTKATMKFNSIIMYLFKIKAKSCLSVADWERVLVLSFIDGAVIDL